jgi:mannose-6-phosphate isomerase-like protein (cupin superfamily)
MAENEIVRGGEAEQFGRRMAISADGTHARPAPQSFGISNIPTFTNQCEGGPLPQAFTVTTALLAQGRSDYLLAGTDRLQIVIKCYASGGENYLHAHTEEDHSFVILDGEATFFGPKGKVGSFGRNQGVLIPRGAYYSFQSTGTTALVLLRMGAPYPGNRAIAHEGHDRTKDSRDAVFPEAVPIKDAFYR